MPGSGLVYGLRTERVLVGIRSLGLEKGSTGSGLLQIWFKGVKRIDLDFVFLGFRI